MFLRGANNFFQLAVAVSVALLASSWWHNSARLATERDVLAQVRELLAENAQLRRAAEAQQAACPAGPAPAAEGRPGGAAAARAEAIRTDDDSPSGYSSWLPTAIISVVTVAYYATLLRRLCLEWQLFQQLRGTQPFLEDLCSFARYRLDLWISNTACWQEICLIGTSIGIILSGGWVFHFVSGSALGPSMSKVWIFLVDQGAHGDLDERLAWCVALLVTVLGMLVFALLISILTERLQQFLEAMRKGHSRVLCSGHVLILGWSDKIPTIIEELAEANSSEGGGMIVILAAEKQKTEMEQEIQFQLDNSQSVYRDIGLRGTKWVVRSGNPMLIADLRMVSVEFAKSIIILVDNTIPPAMADEKTLRTLLGLAGLDHQQKERKVLYSGPKAEDTESPLLRKKRRRRVLPDAANFERQESEGSGEDLLPSPPPELEEVERDGKASQSGQHTVVELTDIDSVPLVEALGSQKTEIVVGHDMAGQLLIQGSREEGLSRIFETIVGFSGPDFYIEEWPVLAGRTFGEAAFCFAAAVPCGLVRSNGRLEMNPPSCCRLEPGDRIVVLAEDNDTYSARADGPLFPYTQGAHAHPRPTASRGPEHILICGWRRDLGDMINELEAAVEAGSTLTLMSLVEEGSRQKRLGENCRTGHTHLKNLTLKHCVGDPTGRKDLEQLPLETYDSVIVVADEELESNANAVAADGHAIATMLLILDIRRARPGDGNKDALRVTSELRDTRTRNLIQATGLSDYVMSHNIVASVIANIAESREVNRILREILSSRGNSLYLKPSTHLADPCEEVTFWELTARARDRKEILLGYQVDDEGTIIVNPLERDKPVCWEGRSFIIMAKAPGPRTKGGSQDEGSSEA
mmetsp:Transcript_71038/g.196159  ORF Transcript_71038/g.196159 Transcript_71038/m.196159 type:complete len:864 (-) Transcript_71038:64-2655(-)